MSGTLYNGIYGYGTYGTAQYGIGGVTLSTEAFVFTDVASRVRTSPRSVTETITLTDIMSIIFYQAEKTRIIINGSMSNGNIPRIPNIMNSDPLIKGIMQGIPKISNVMSSAPAIGNVMQSIPQFRRSMPYGYNT